MKQSEARGRLVAIGGGDVTGGDAPLLREFVRLSKGAKARIVVLTVATDEPAEAGAECRDAFRRLGVDDVRVADVSARGDAHAEKSLEAIERATGLYFTGGDQLHITSLLGGTEMQRLIHRRYEKGVVVAGSSAGAAMMSNSMIVDGESEGSPRLGAVEIGPGMDLISGAIIDTHFAERGRFGRLLAAVAHYPQVLGLGIDEDTAVVVGGGEFEVIGEGAVTVIDGGAMTYTNLPYAEEKDALALYGVRVHVLPAGHRFDLTGREPVVEEDEPKRGRIAQSDKGKSKKRTKG